MNRRDLVAFETFYRDTLRREARARAKRYPAVAEQLNRWADAADMRIEAVRSGPLFDQEGGR
mgnify:CR=1 FL=1|jgi:hypothetical protein